MNKVSLEDLAEQLDEQYTIVHRDIPYTHPLHIILQPDAAVAEDEIKVRAILSKSLIASFNELIAVLDERTTDKQKVLLLDQLLTNETSELKLISKLPPNYIADIAEQRTCINKTILLDKGKGDDELIDIGTLWNFKLIPLVNKGQEFFGRSPDKRTVRNRSEANLHQILDEYNPFLPQYRTRAYPLAAEKWLVRRGYRKSWGLAAWKVIKTDGDNGDGDEYIILMADMGSSDQGQLSKAKLYVQLWNNKTYKDTSVTLYKGGGKSNTVMATKAKTTKAKTTDVVTKAKAIKAKTTKAKTTKAKTTKAKTTKAKTTKAKTT